MWWDCGLRGVTSKSRLRQTPISNLTSACASAPGCASQDAVSDAKGGSYWPCSLRRTYSKVPGGRRVVWSWGSFDCVGGTVDCGGLLASHVQGKPPSQTGRARAHPRPGARAKMQFLMQSGVRTGRAVYGERTAKYPAAERIRAFSVGLQGRF